MKKYARLLRVKHYMKNLLVCLPAFFALSLFRKEVLAQLAYGWVCFSLTASVVYIINDIRDRDRDRLNEQKRTRPVASGEIPVKRAVLAAVFLAVMELLLAALTLAHFAQAQGCLLLYLALNLAYSFGLKDIPILDVFILASGFVLRVLFGAVITEVECSNWLILTVITISLYLGLGKRLSEMKAAGNHPARKVLQYYSTQYLHHELKTCETLGIIFYALWSAETASSQYGAGLIWTAPAVLGIVMRYNMNLELSNKGDPVEVVLHDKALMALIAGYGAAMCGILYWNR